MRLIQVPRLRLARLQTLAETTIKICLNIVALGDALKNVQDALISFKQGMLKDRTSTKDKKRLDFKRDEFLTGFIGNVHSEQKFPHDDEIILKALVELLEIVEKYGLNMKRLPHDEETAAIDNMLADISEVDVSSLTLTGLPRWIPEIDKANTEFKGAASVFISDTSTASDTQAATWQVPKLEDALEGIYAMVFALLKTSPSDELKKIYGELETLVESMK